MRDGNALHRSWILWPEFYGGGVELHDDRPSVVYSASCTNFETGYEAAREEEWGDQLRGWASLAQTLQYRGAICVVAATDVVWMGLGSDPVLGKAAWGQQHFLRSVGAGETFGYAFRDMKRDVHASRSSLGGESTHILRNWLNYNLLGDPSQKLVTDISSLPDDEYDRGRGNDSLDRSTVLYSSAPIVHSEPDVIVRVTGAISKDGDCYVLRGLGRDPKSVHIRLKRNQRLGDIYLEVFDADRIPIRGEHAADEEQRTFTSSASTTSGTVYIRVKAGTHVNEYDLEVEIDR